MGNCDGKKAKEGNENNWSELGQKVSDLVHIFIFQEFILFFKIYLRIPANVQFYPSLNSARYGNKFSFFCREEASFLRDIDTRVATSYYRKNSKCACQGKNCNVQKKVQSTCNLQILSHFLCTPVSFLQLEGSFILRFGDRISLKSSTAARVNGPLKSNWLPSNTFRRTRAILRKKIFSSKGPFTHSNENVVIEVSSTFHRSLIAQKSESFPFSRLEGARAYVRGLGRFGPVWLVVATSGSI